MRTILAVVVTVGLLAAGPMWHGVSAEARGKAKPQPTRLCRFQNQVWGVVQDTAYEEATAGSADATDESDNEYTVSQDMKGLINRLVNLEFGLWPGEHYPPSERKVSADLSQDWGGLPNIAEQSELYFTALEIGDTDSADQFFQAEQDYETFFWQDMNTTWTDLKAVCRT